MVGQEAVSLASSGYSALFLLRHDSFPVHSLHLPFHLSCCILTWVPMAEFCQPNSLGLVPKLFLYIHFVAAHQSVVSPTFTVHGSSDHMGDQCLPELWLLFPHPRKPVYLCSVSCIPHGCLSQGASDAQAHVVISSPSAPTTINGLQTACSTMSPSTLKLLSAGTPPSHLTLSVQSHPR